MENKLIMVVVNRGFAEQVVEESRKQGARGATILHGRGSAGIGEKFLGMEITPEKEVIMIVGDTATADNIQKHLDEVLRNNPAEGGICFALPVSVMT